MSDQVHELVLRGGRVVDPSSGLGGSLASSVTGGSARYRPTSVTPVGTGRQQRAKRAGSSTYSAPTSPLAHSAGADADVVVINPSSYPDKATNEACTRPPNGGRHLVVSGTPVVLGGALQLDARPGQPVRGANA